MRLSIDINRQRVGRDGKCAVRLTIHHHGRARYTFPFRIEPSRWDEKQRRVRPGPSSVEYNRTLANVLQRADILGLEVGSTAEWIAHRLARPEVSGLRLSEAARQVLEDQRSKFAPDTRNRLGFIVRMIEKAIPDATVTDLSLADVIRYREVIAARGVGQNTLRSRVKLLRVLYHHACDMHGVEPKAVFRKLIPREIDTDARYLELPELSIASRYKGPQDIMLARDTVLLQTYLGGMRFGDVWELRPEKVEGDRFAPRQAKSKNIVTIPIIPQAREIIERHKGGKRVLPLPYSAKADANTYVNKRLKILAAACGINPKLSTHYARGTWANWANHSGEDINTISKVLGHKSIKTTIGYLSRFPKKAIDEAFDKFSKAVG